MAETPQEPAPRRSRWIIGAAAAAAAAVLAAVVVVIVELGGGGGSSDRGASVEIALPPPPVNPGRRPIRRWSRRPRRASCRSSAATAASRGRSMPAISTRTDRRPVVADRDRRPGARPGGDASGGGTAAPAVALAYSPYAERSRRGDRGGAQGRARSAAGPADGAGRLSAPGSGPETLLTSLDAVHNLARLAWVMGRGTGYVGTRRHHGRPLRDAAGKSRAGARGAREARPHVCRQRRRPDECAPAISGAISALPSRSPTTASTARPARLRSIRRLPRSDHGSAGWRGLGPWHGLSGDARSRHRLGPDARQEEPGARAGKRRHRPPAPRTAKPAP